MLELLRGGVVLVVLPAPPRRRHPATESVYYDLQCSVHLDPTSHRISIEDKPVEMGPTEFRLLKFFLVNQEKVFSRDHIQDSVWGGNVYLEERTIDVHIRRLRKALSSVEDTSIDYSRLIQTVRGAGYRFSVRPS